MDKQRTKIGCSAKRSKKYSNQAKYMRGKNPKVTHAKGQTESQNESPDNGNTECHDKRPIYPMIISLKPYDVTPCLQCCTVGFFGGKLRF